MTALTDKFLKVAAAGSETYMASPGKPIGASSFTINSATGFPTDTAFIIAIRVVNAQGVEVDNTYSEWLCTLSGTTVSLGSSPFPVIGTDYDYPAGETTQVYVPLSSYRDNRLIDALLSQHNQDGSHGAVTATSLSVSGTTTLGATTASSATVSGDGTISGNLTVSGQLQVTAGSTSSGSTITPTSQVYSVTALAAAATVNVPSFTAWDGAPFIIRILDNGTSRALTFAAGYTNQSGLDTPTATVAGKLMTIGGMYSASTSKWQILSISQEA